ncbi:MAG TPA: 6-phosphogluconolactonase [Rhizomicrobium sp.]
MKNDPLLRRFADADTMIRTLADEIVVNLNADITARGAASFVASGGTTPGPLFDLLSKRDLAWDKVWVTLSDERWIAPTEDGSNENLIRTRLLRNKAATAHLVAMKTDDASPNDGEAKVGAALTAMRRPFTVTLLGMGDDGHTASLFPHAQGLETALDVNNPALARAVHTHDVATTGERMTLTLRAILDSKLIVILIKGDTKMDAYRNALSGTDVAAAPVRAVLQQSKTPVQVFWAP